MIALNQIVVVTLHKKIIFFLFYWTFLQIVIDICQLQVLLILYGRQCWCRWRVIQGAIFALASTRIIFIVFNDLSRGFGDVSNIRIGILLAKIIISPFFIMNITAADKSACLLPIILQLLILYVRRLVNLIIIR